MRRSAAALLFVMLVSALGCRSAHPADCADCVPVPTTEKTSTWVYGSNTEPKCYLRPASPLCDWLCHSESDGPTCSPPVPRTVLIKRRVETESPAWKCEPCPTCAENAGR